LPTDTPTPTATLAPLRFAYLPLVLKVCCVVLPTLTATPTDTATATQSPTSTDRVLVSRVIDGDTIELADGRRLRYIGMDTPEMDGECYGIEAKEKNRQLVEGRFVRLEKDVSETDRYGRLLRYVWVDIGFGEFMVNAQLLAEGYAQVSTFPPDVKYVTWFLQLQTEARNAGRGLWSACVPTPTVTPTATASGTPTATATRTATWTATATGTVTPAYTATATRTPTRTATATVTQGPANVRIAPECSQWDAPGNDNQNLNEEYVCFYNHGATAADMSGWHIKDAANNTYNFPTFTLAAGASVRVHTGSGTNTATDLYWGRGSAVWNNGGDTVYLYNAAWGLVDSYTY